MKAKGRVFANAIYPVMRCAVIGRAYEPSEARQYKNIKHKLASRQTLAAMGSPRAHLLGNGKTQEDDFGGC
jgi:hypothetical protein